MRKTLWISLVAALALLVSPGPARAQEIVIKLGTLAPVGSIWHQLLKEAAQDFESVSGGKVKLKIFAGGTMGNEGDMLKKIRIGQLQAAGLSTVGLKDVTSEPMALDLPLLVTASEERDHLLSKIGPKLEASLAKKGYVVLSWSEIGMVRFFSTQPRPTLPAMRESKLFVWEGDPASADAWKALGFKTVVLSATDIIPSFQTGMINAIAYPPTVSLAIRLHDKAKYMSDLVLSSLTGVTVVDKKTWDKVPADLQPKLMEITRKLGQRTVEQARKMESDAIAKMKAQGLQVVKITDLPEWRKAVDAASGTAVRGKVVPADLFDEVQRLMKEYRAGKAGKP